MNVLDFWKAEGDGPRPLLVYIHGGGWVQGDKKQPAERFVPYLEKGVSYAAINYRLTGEVPLPAPTRVTGAVLTDHMRSVDWIARNCEFHSHAPQDIVDEVTARIEAIIINC